MVTGVAEQGILDIIHPMCYYVDMLKNINTIFKENYYRFNPGEFLPVYSGGELINKKEFHQYRIKWIIRNRSVFFHQLTHTSSY